MGAEPPTAYVESISTVVRLIMRTPSPIVLSILRESETSSISGRFSIIHLSSTSRHPMRMGSAAFFIPLTSIEPRRGEPPFITIFSIVCEHLSVADDHYDSRRTEKADKKKCTVRRTRAEKGQKSPNSIITHPRKKAKSFLRKNEILCFEHISQRILSVIYQVIASGGLFREQSEHPFEAFGNICKKPYSIIICRL